jgi:3-phenylpropionate/trans-cinnamate dioxygenase ferredoxin reductase subunit
VLRTADDAAGLAAALDRRPRVVVVGAGFLGMEVAAACRTRGLEVVVVEIDRHPLSQAPGAFTNSYLLDLHRRRGMRFVLGEQVSRVLGGSQIEAVEVCSGRRVQTDIVIWSIGASPTTAWLRHSGLHLSDGVHCDAGLRVCVSGVARPDIVALGDVANWPVGADASRRRSEHWTNSTGQARVAARNLLSVDQGDPAVAFAEPAYVWSTQYDVQVQVSGSVTPGASEVVTAGDPVEGRFASRCRTKVGLTRRSA